MYVVCQNYATGPAAKTPVSEARNTALTIIIFYPYFFCEFHDNCVC
jgi:hypothetical protein